MQSGIHSVGHFNLFCTLLMDMLSLCTHQKGILHEDACTEALRPKPANLDVHTPLSQSVYTPSFQAILKNRNEKPDWSILCAPRPNRPIRPSVRYLRDKCIISQFEGFSGTGRGSTTLHAQSKSHPPVRPTTRPS